MPAHPRVCHRASKLKPRRPLDDSPQARARRAQRALEARARLELRRYPRIAIESYRDRELKRRYAELEARFSALDRSNTRPSPYLFLHLARCHQWWARPLETWNPRGARRRSQRRLQESLIDHLLVPRFAPPRALYEAFWIWGEPESDWLRGWRATRAPSRSMSPWVWAFICVARGASLYETLRHQLGLSLSRRGCHLFSVSEPGESLIATYRRAQLEGHGLPPSVVSALHGSFLSRGLQVGEAFYDEVFAWLARRPELRPEAGKRFISPCEIPPLLDYLKHRHDEGDPPEMRRVDLRALMTRMERWHLALGKTYRGLQMRTPFPKDGLTPMRWAEEGVASGAWVMLALRTEGALVEEGQRMRHCVASYAHAAHKGHSSIWSLRHGDLPQLTVEVRPRSRAIVQARGRSNRPPTALERRHLEAWAKANRLSIGAGV